ncbi:MAG: ParB/RepB/Spo0J family partition protein [Planctomycetes bacterium]|nr:ParB/RepB/Spo0J family partition protein [Planctomycetota bacterium]
MADKKLGRGLDGIVRTVARPPVDEIGTASPAGTTLPLAILDANPFQPRQGMEPADLEHLKASILEHGVLQPIIVRRNEDRYQVIAGERRLRAAQAAGLLEVPVVVREATDEEMLELALVENLQREDLDPIEKATSFRAYLERSNRTQDAAAARLGLDRSTIANMIRLLDLPLEVQAMVRTDLVTMGHARAILSVDNPKRQVEIAQRVAREGLSVRQVERLAATLAPARRRARRLVKDAHIADLEARLREALGTKVCIEQGAKAGTGRIVVEFYSNDDFERILARLS